MNKENIIWIFVFVFLVNIVYAQPPLYHEFYGDMKCTDGNSVNDGVGILVKLDGVDNSNIVSNNGRYHVIVQGTIGQDGVPVEFYIASEIVGSDSFVSFGFSNLDLETMDNSLCEGGAQNGDGNGNGNGNGGSYLECNDNIDNDNDDLIDYPSDLGCIGVNDDNETDVSAPPVPPGGCSNECNASGFSCLNETTYRTCGNYDSDSCFDWSNSIGCGEGYICNQSEGGCILEDEDGFEFPLGRLFIEGIIPYAIGVGVLIVVGISIWLIIRGEHKSLFNKINFLKRDNDKFYKLSKK